MKNLIIVIAIALAIAGGWYIWSNNQNPSIEQTSQITENVESDTQEEVEVDSQNSLVDLLQSGGNQMCTYNYNGDDGTTITGTTYISGEMMRNNYELTGNNQDMTGSMIRNGETLYIWASSMPEGIKMTFSMEDLMQDVENAEDSQSETPDKSWGPVDPNMEIDYDCESWNPDENMFNPPSDVTFRDMSAIMENLPENMDSCQICESLQGTALEACRESFKCE